MKSKPERIARDGKRNPRVKNRDQARKQARQAKHTMQGRAC